MTSVSYSEVTRRAFDPYIYTQYNFIDVHRALFCDCPICVLFFEYRSADRSHSIHANNFRWEPYSRRL